MENETASKRVDGAAFAAFIRNNFASVETLFPGWAEAGTVLREIVKGVDGWCLFRNGKGVMVCLGGIVLDHKNGDELRPGYESVFIKRVPGPHIATAARLYGAVTAEYLADVHDEVRAGFLTSTRESCEYLRARLVQNEQRLIAMGMPSAKQALAIIFGLSVTGDL